MVTKGDITMMVHQEILCEESVLHFDIPNDKPLRLTELLTLLMLATKHGYAIKTARDMKSQYDEVSSDIYAVWYAVENGIDIFADNISRLIGLVGLKCSVQ